MNNRRTGKIARLSKEWRDVVNLMIQDGATYAQIIARLGEHGDGINEQNLVSWKQGGYADWEKENERLQTMKLMRESALDIVRQNDGSKIHEAGLQLAASQLYELLTEIDLSSVKELLKEKPENYAAIVNSLTKLSKGALEIQKYQDAVSRAQSELKKLRDPKAEMSDADRNVVLDKVDEILGLK